MKKIFIIAEIAQAHDGSLGIAHSYIDELSKTGVDAIKFQTHIACAESSEFEEFRINFSYQDKTRFDYWKRMEFSKEEWIGLKNHCESRNIEFISSPFSNSAVDLLESIGVKRYKVGSGEINNLLLLKKIALTKKPIILSSGMSNWNELDKVTNFLNQHKIDITLLQCYTAYPTLPGKWGINIIPKLKEKYKLKVGYSDHSGKIYPSIAAITLGAEVIEIHAVFDKNMFGPDAKASLTIKQIKKLVKAIRELEIEFSDNCESKQHNDDIMALKNIFEKSLAINKELKAGDFIRFEDLEAKKPKDKGINPLYFENVVGKKIIRNIKAYSFINNDDLYE